jgi:hypothetical protein
MSEGRTAAQHRTAQSGQLVRAEPPEMLLRKHNNVCNVAGEQQSPPQSLPPKVSSCLG